MPPFVFVLVGGWPGSGKSTLAAALAPALGLPLLVKDLIKEELMDAAGAPASVPESRDLGRAAVLEMLRRAAACPGAVLDSTWYDYALPLVDRLPGPKVEVRCIVPLEVALARYRARRRDQRHLDHLRSVDELWGAPVPPLGVGPLVEVDTNGDVDAARVARRIVRALEEPDA